MDFSWEAILGIVVSGCTVLGFSFGIIKWIWNIARTHENFQTETEIKFKTIEENFQKKSFCGSCIDKEFYEKSQEKTLKSVYEEIGNMAGKFSHIDDKITLLHDAVNNTKTQSLLAIKDLSNKFTLIDNAMKIFVKIEDDIKEINNEVKEDRKAIHSIEKDIVSLTKIHNKNIIDLEDFHRSQSYARE